MATWTTGFANYLAPGASVTLAFTWPAGQDPGVQTLVARPRAPKSMSTAPAFFNIRREVTTETVRVAVCLNEVPGWTEGGWGYNGYTKPTPGDRYQPEWTYSATIRNEGKWGVWCELIGGQVV